MSLLHEGSDCAGCWHQRSSSASMFWGCDQCGAVADHSVEVAEAALREKQLGTTLQRLSDAGDWLIEDKTEDLD